LLGANPKFGSTKLKEGFSQKIYHLTSEQKVEGCAGSSRIKGREK
jgi:hypothetical protein